MNKINISVIIPVFNRKNSLRKCLTSLFQEINQGNHKDVEVIVVDDCSTENLKDCTDQFPVSFYRLDKNSGPATSRNFGVTKAKGDIIFFIDSDVLLQKNTLLYLKNNFKTNKDIAAIQGNYTKRPYFTNFLTKYKNSLLYHNFFASKKQYRTGISTFCVAIKKDVFNEIGGFNKNLQRLEDEEFGIIMCAKEKKVLFDNNIQVKHMKRYNPLNFLKEDFNTGFLKIKSLFGNKFSINNLEGSHLRIRYLSTIPISNLILLNIILLFFLNTFWIRMGFVILFVLYLLLNLKLYSFLIQEGIIFTVVSFLFSFIHNFLIVVAMLSGIIHLIIKGGNDELFRTSKPHETQQ